MVRIKDKRLVITSNGSNLDFESLLIRQRSIIRLVQCAKLDSIDEDSIYFAMEMLDDMLLNEEQMKLCENN